MARPKLYSYEKFSDELSALCEKYKRLEPKEMVKAMGYRSAFLYPDAIAVLIEEAFKAKTTLRRIEASKENVMCVTFKKKGRGRPRKNAV